MLSKQKIRVLVVDDSAIVRKLVSDALNADPEIEVVGTAIDPYVARDKIVELDPDVLTLDIEMPRMDGISFLKIMMKYRPMPIIIMSSLTQKGSGPAMEALDFGAVDVLAKPGSAYSVGDLGDDLVRKVKGAYAARHRYAAKRAKIEAERNAVMATASLTSDIPERKISSAVAVSAVGAAVLDGRGVVKDSRSIILLGASTGGTEALKDVLTMLPNNLPGICIVQHIPAYFSTAFAKRLNDLCQMEVREAVDGDEVRPGLALLAPGDYHMLLGKKPGGAGYVVHLKQGPKVWHQRPAVDLLFQSAAPIVGKHAIAGILTGMGQDGAKGLLDLKQNGARTFAQDEASCVVFGMPHAAMKLGAAEKMVPLQEIPRHMLNLLS